MTFSKTLPAQLMLIGLCTILGATPTVAQENFTRGDVNCDGVIDTADVSKLSAHLFQSLPLPCEDAGDFDDDGWLMIFDMTALTSFVTMGGAAPPPPYPDCGPDPTADALGCGTNCCGGGGACPISMPGDCNEDEVINSGDVIAMVNYVFKAGLAPLPCEATGDANCSGQVTSADIIWMVGYVFKSQEPPCDICTMIPDPWSCP